MSCVAWPNQIPIGTASNFLQCKWVSCSKSYWQGYDLGWYKDMGVPCFPQPNLWLARCASMSWTALKKFVILSTQELRIGKNLHSIAGGKRGRFCWCSVYAVCCVCSVLRRLAVCAVLRDGARWRRWWAQRHNRAMRPQCFIPTSQKHSLSLLVSPARTSGQRQTRRPRLLFSVSAKCLHERQQQQQGAARSSNNRQAVGERQVSSRWAAAGKQEQVAASSSMEQQAAGKQQVSSRWAAGGQQVSSNR